MVTFGMPLFTFWGSSAYSHTPLMLFLVWMVVMGSASSRIENSKTKVYKQCSRPSQWAITFDDGPSENIPAIREVLRSKGVKATFFINGNNYAHLETNEIDQRNLLDLYLDGHQIGTHTYSHADLLALSNDVDLMKKEMTMNDDTIMKIIGVKPTYMRPPYMSFDENVLSLLAEWGYTVIGANLDTKDYYNSRSNDENETIRLNQAHFDQEIRRGHSSWISLNHDFTLGVVLWISNMIEQIRSIGYQLVTVQECIQGPPAYVTDSTDMTPTFSPSLFSPSTSTLSTLTASMSFTTKALSIKESYSVSKAEYQTVSSFHDEKSRKIFLPLTLAWLIFS